MSIRDTILILILLWAIPINSTSQHVPNTTDSVDYVQVWLDQIPPAQMPSAQNYLLELDLFIKELNKKRPRYKDPTQFLKFVYYKVHRKYLRRYQPHSTLLDLLQDRKYDCLTGTALYAIILDKLEVVHSIVETSYHIYLTLDIDGRTVLMESTNPLSGFIDDQQMVTATVQRYRQDEAGENWKNKEYYKFSQPVENQINLIQLAGLQYFNQAVAAYNNKKLMPALSDLVNALDLYPSNRIKEMMVVMLNALEQDQSIDPLFKQEYLNRYDHLRNSFVTAFRKN